MTCRHGSPSDKCRICSLEKEVQSQKEEIEEYKERYTDSQFHVKALADVEAVHLQQIESLKAITELAVKELRWYADIDNHLELGRGGTLAGIDEGLKARTTLSEIERIQSEQT